MGHQEFHPPDQLVPPLVQRVGHVPDRPPPFHKLETAITVEVPLSQLRREQLPTDRSGYFLNSVTKSTGCLVYHETLNSHRPLRSRTTNKEQVGNFTYPYRHFGLEPKWTTKAPLPLHTSFLTYSCQDEFTGAVTRLALTPDYKRFYKQVYKMRL